MLDASAVAGENCEFVVFIDCCQIPSFQLDRMVRKVESKDFIFGRITINDVDFS